MVFKEESMSEGCSERPDAPGDHPHSAKDVEGFHGGDLTKLEQEKICFNFTIGNSEKREFYSPGFPNNYPNNTKCELQLKAPHGHVIQLDFRETFHLEESPTCEYDWLEIRNGPHGYSPLIDRFCGHEFPPLLVSKDRFLWLKFSSDDSIEYEGFKAIYEFVHIKDFDRPQAEDCVYSVGGAGGLISPSDVSKSILNYSTTWKVPLDCTWSIEVEPGWKMYVNFQKYELKHPNNCDLNFIDIYEQELSDDTRMAQFCGTATEPQKSDGNRVYVRYFAHNDALDGKFEIVYTAFRESDKCIPTEFSCDDGTCIDKSLKCNKMYNCKYRYDEDPALCTPAMTASRMLTSEHMITILVVFFALVLAMCASIVITCYNKVKDRREKKREYKLRRSKEVSMEGEMDRVLEAALAAQAAEIGAARSRKPAPPHRWMHDEEESNGCYVPEVDLSIFHKSPNGGHVISRDNGIHVISNSYPDGVNPLCREHGRRGSLSPPLPPPPPPPHVRRTPQPDNPPCQKHNPSFRYEADEEDDPLTVVPLSQKFRGPPDEVGAPDSRPPSFDSTRSAPDVIVHR
ncbi:neuropilin and tolloid-like protein 2 [Uloborus diversus]|uniref:neuropilin and tolloid-like protein 2 n=1 Tax=Uloborus diversus TaxID=327109 RepID=UPI002409E994|nr:neuropilin and tolloid-like protein 2 [Uloborus diversus]